MKIRLLLLFIILVINALCLKLNSSNTASNAKEINDLKMKISIVDQAIGNIKKEIERINEQK